MNRDRNSEAAPERRDHSCLLYRSQSDLKGFVLPFIREGLNSGEHCLFVCLETEVDDWLIEFQAAGIDVIGYRESGALVVATGEQWRTGTFNSVAKARELWRHIDGKLNDFPAVRIIGDASWTMLHPPIASGDACHWEATADLLYEDLPVKTICAYDLDLHPPSGIRAALRTHSRVILGHSTFRNPHYESPQIVEMEPALNNSDAGPEMIEEMLEALLRGGPILP